MIRFVEFLAILVLVVGGLTTAYLLIRHYHRKWYWQDKVNENNIRRAILEEMEIQYEVDPSGFVRPVKRRRPE